MPRPTKEAYEPTIQLESLEPSWNVSSTRAATKAISSQISSSVPARRQPSEKLGRKWIARDLGSSRWDFFSQGAAGVAVANLREGKSDVLREQSQLIKVSAVNVIDIFGNDTMTLVPVMVA